MTDLREISKGEILVLLISSLLIFLTLFYHSQSLIVATDTSQNLIPTIHLKHNAYFHLTSFGYWASSRVGCAIIIVLGLIGSTAVFSYHSISPSISLAVSAIIFAVVAVVFEYDFLVIAPLASVTWLYLIICTSNSSKVSFLVLLSALIFTLWLLLYALSIPTLMLALLLYFIVNQRRLERSIRVVLFLGGLTLFLLTVFSPTLPWPDYPPHARVTSMIAGPPWLARPIIGEDLPFHTIDRAALIFQYESLLLPLAIIIFFSSLLIRYRPIAKRAWICCAILLTIAYLDLRLPEEFAQIAPALSFPRLIPELSMIPMTPILLSIVLAGLTTIIMLSIFRSNVGAFLGVLVICNFILFNQDVVSTSSLAATIPLEWSSSPSRFTTSFFSVDVLNNARSQAHSVRPRPQNIIITSSNADAVDKKTLLDRDTKTRWTSAKGKQTGAEWLMFEMSNPQKLIGLELQTGAYETDFPRGLNIKAGNSCSLDSMQTIVSFKNWQGSPNLTPNGYPYFSAQSEVRIFFPKEIEASCFRIEQTGKSDTFDWSVAELKLIKRTNPQNNKLEILEDYSSSNNQIID